MSINKLAPKPQWLLLKFFVQKGFETNLNFRYQRVQTQKNEKRKTFLLFKLLKLTTFVPLVFLISYLLVPIIKSCLKYFLDKNPKKQP